MRLPRVRFTVRRAMAIVAIAALLARVVRVLMPPRPFTGQRFALIGRVDIDRDGRDDRAALTRMIRRAGGSVDFDLPPSGPAKGQIGTGTSWYVFDERVSLANRGPGETAIIQRARLDGVRAISIDRLLSRLRGR